MSSPWSAALFVLVIWWLSTGVIIAVVSRADRMGRRGHLKATAFALPFLILGGFGYEATLDDPSVAGASLAFLSALAVWGWVELAFLAGVLTGPAPRSCPPGAGFAERLVRAWGTIAYAQMALTAAFGVMVYSAQGAENAFGMWTFAILYFARISAQVNVFLGVPKINVEFLPGPVRHLESHFRIAPMNWAFPFSITALTFAAACWVERAYAAETAGEITGFVLLAALTALATLEHWLMIAPLPDAALWRWMMPRDRSDTSTTAGRKTPKTT